MCGMRVHGIDLSETGVRSAQRLYGSAGIEFVVGDALRIPFARKFDCVFTRSLSLYNSEDFRSDSYVTEVLLSSVREGGCLIFLYNTKLAVSKMSGTWRYHSFTDAQKHFSRCRDYRLFFISKIDTLVLGRHAFNAACTTLNSFMSTRFGIGGDLVCVVRKTKSL
jgi:SAM-dependent methyltransferase